MKKNYLLTALMILGSLCSFSQLGTTTYNTATDAGSNYSSATWLDGSNLGIGFGTWKLTNSATNGGVYIGGTGQGANSFGLYSENGVNFASAERNLSSDLKRGESILVSIGHTATINGQVLLQLLDDNDVAFTLKFVGNTSNWQINDGGSDFEIGQAYAANTSLDFSFSYNEDGTYSYTFGSANGTDFNSTNTISGINSIKFQSINQGGNENFGFNNLSINSKYTINNNATVTVSEITAVPYLDVQAGSSINLNTGIGLTVSGDLTNNGSITANHGSSLIVDNASLGNITYKVNVTDTNWHLISSPVSGQDYDDTWANANSIANGNGTNRGISTYQNGTSDANTGPWVYMQTAESGTFNSGTGYSLKRDTSGDYTFTGGYQNANVSPALSQNENNWNLIGNPYASYLNIADFISTNNEVNNFNLSDSFLSVYVWNSSEGNYAPLTVGHIYPGQAFFVNSKLASGNATITKAMQSHQTGANFYKNANPSISLNLSNGTSVKTTQINYLEAKTTGLDLGFDIGMFDGVSSDIRLYTQLLEEDEGIAFARQGLPNLNMESMVIPIGVNAEAGNEITFTAEALNLPSDLKLFLEDRNTNTITRLDEANGNYKIIVPETINGIGRFYLHTKTNSVLNTDNFLEENVSVYKLNASTLRIVGLPQGNATVSLFNMLGKQMINSTFRTNGVSDISLPQLATGVYLIKITTNNGKLNKKIILN
jgi:hypothetical protein